MATQRVDVRGKTCEVCGANVTDESRLCGSACLRVARKRKREAKTLQKEPQP